MKRIILLLLCSINLCCLAQDIIVTRDLKRIDAKITEVSETEVRYKKSNNLDGPVFIIFTEKVSTILYANGDVQSFEQKEAVPKAKETIIEHVVDFDPLYRDGGRIVSGKSYPYEPNNLREILGRDGYGNYLSAQSQYGKGAACVTFGWIDAVVGISMAVTGTLSELPTVAITGYILAVASDVLLPVGYVVRGTAAGRISRIAEGYNAVQNRNLGMDMDVVPTLMLASDGTPVLGIGFSFHF